MNHSPEPWKAESACDGGDYILDANEIPVCGHETEFNGLQLPITTPPETLQRIVACVNFCRQFPTTFLASHTALNLAPNKTPDDGWRTLADIPNLHGLLAVQKNTE